MERFLCAWSPNWAIANWRRRNPSASPAEPLLPLSSPIGACAAWPPWTRRPRRRGCSSARRRPTPAPSSPSWSSPTPTRPRTSPISRPWPTGARASRRPWPGSAGRPLPRHVGRRPPVGRRARPDGRSRRPPGATWRSPCAWRWPRRPAPPGPSPGSARTGRAFRQETRRGRSRRFPSPLCACPRRAAAQLPRLGLETVGALVGLPRGALTRRFGGRGRAAARPGPRPGARGPRLPPAARAVVRAPGLRRADQRAGGPRPRRRPTSRPCSARSWRRADRARAASNWPSTASMARRGACRRALPWPGAIRAASPACSPRSSRRSIPASGSRSSP